jgi:glutathione synthase/RimK-type ligase-like ATP-grasp enzyme
MESKMVEWVMNTLLILYSGDDWQLEEPDYKPSYEFAYKLWGKLCAEQNIQLLRAEMNWFKNDQFQKYWRYNSELDKWIKEETAVRPDAIYDKTLNGAVIPEELINTSLIINYSDFTKTFSSKLNQATIFSEFQPKTSYLPANAVYDNPSGEQRVIKKIYGSGGQGVSFSKELQIKSTVPCLIQEFIEYGGNDLRDYRLQFINEELIFAYSRIAAAGSLYTNVSLGARMEYIELADLPIPADYLERIKSKLAAFKKKIYCLDFLIAKDGSPILIEINTKPGLGGFDNEQGEKILTNYLLKLTECITQ